MGARRHGQGGPPENIVKCFCAANVVWSLIRRIIYALFWENVVRPHLGSAPGPRWETSVLQTPSLPLWKKSCGLPWAFRWNFAWIFIMWVGVAEKVFKIMIRDHRSQTVMEIVWTRLLLNRWRYLSQNLHNYKRRLNNYPNSVMNIVLVLSWLHAVT